MTPEYLCNLVVPGAAKSGTSSLHEALNQHPDICMSTSKEPHYFARREFYSRGPKFHNELFSQIKGGQYFGESSTGYMICPRSIDKISKDLSNPKVIMVLRDPVSRTFSHWRWRAKLGLEKRPFMQAIRADGYGYDPEQPDRFGYMAYLQFSNYSKYCPLWISAFGEENCLVITTDELKENFQGTMTKCFSFLNLDDYIFQAEVSVNNTEKIGARPKPFMTKIMSLVQLEIKNRLFYQKFRNSILRKYSPNVPTAISEQERNYLEIVLKDDIDYFHSIKV